MSSAFQRDGVYVRRREEADILHQVELVRADPDRASRVLVLYGAGGVGKTRLVRTLAADHDGHADRGVVWVRPIDVDDSEYWLLSNLERVVAERLDPGRRHFGPYFDYLSRLPRYTREQIGHETVVSHLGRIKDTFVNCYRSFVTETGTTVVVTLDTVEAVRSMYLLLTLTQWMKSLPGTLFILSGRPLTRREHQDPIRDQLEDPHRRLPWTTVTLRGFSPEEALDFLDRSPLSAQDDADEPAKLIHLTQGHPLWMAMAVDYLQHSDPPPEMDGLDEARRAEHLPYGGELTQEGARLCDAFRRRLVAPYRSTDFWPEAIKRLAVVRHSVSREVWQFLMEDRPLPDGADTWDQAWEQLLRRPWVRPRANQRYVTLHDALAEELAQRLIPLHDRDGTWRQWLWRRAAQAYPALIDEPDRRLRHEQERLGAAIRTAADQDDPALITRVTELDAAKRELDQLRTARLHYQLLSDFDAGTANFIELYERAVRSHDLLFQELICHELERFLPNGATAEPLEDVLGPVVESFHRWLREDAPVQYLEMGLRIASFLTQNEQPRTALELLSALPESVADPELRYRLHNERGNACMRIPGQVDRAHEYFQLALDETSGFASPERERRGAEARKEFGFYYRNLGRWHDADQAYQQARDVMSSILGPGSSHDDREEMASIQTNWAYLKALQGNYLEARNLVESAIAVRRRLGKLHGVGVSLSVSGEVYRYDHQFVRAWQNYEEAEAVFQELKSWPWLGLVYQEKAICLHQAGRDGVVILPDQAERAAALIRQSMDICREQAIRSYPSALNRAGRIFGKDVDTALGYLDEAIDEARKVADGWFLSANLIEYLELSYRAWLETGRRAYRELIDARIQDVGLAITDYNFPDLRGRWELLQGHLAVHDALDRGRFDDLDHVVGHYSTGFVTLADERVGSHGSAAIAREFQRFRDLFTQLPVGVQTQWYSRLRLDWSDPQSGDRSTSLLARLEELY
jgi:tetratricopeptide (TPR) repeat protein